MNYFVELDAWISAVLLGGEEDEDYEEWFARVKKQLKEKILESYRNGQKAGQEPLKPVAEKSREARPRKFWPRRDRGGRQ